MFKLIIDFFRKNELIKDLQLKVVTLESENKKLQERLLVKDIDNFIKRQPAVKLILNERQYECLFCHTMYKAKGVDYYCQPLCPYCRLMLKDGYISQEELAQSIKDKNAK